MILILDFGSQYTQLIARRVRESHVYCELHPFNLSLERIRELRPEGIILSGGPASVYQADAPLSDPRIAELGRAGARDLLRHGRARQGGRRRARRAPTRASSGRRS